MIGIGRDLGERRREIGREAQKREKCLKCKCQIGMKNQTDWNWILLLSSNNSLPVLDAPCQLLALEYW